MLLNFSSMVYRPWLVALQTFSRGFRKQAQGGNLLRLFCVAHSFFHPASAQVKLHVYEKTDLHLGNLLHPWRM
jgi:hypothetical protein